MVLTNSGSGRYHVYVINDVMKFSISEISNDDVSGTGRPIDFVFDLRLGFSGTADRMTLFPVSPNPRWRLAAMLENFKWPYLSNGSSDRLRV